MFAVVNNVIIIVFLLLLLSLHMYKVTGNVLTLGTLL